MGAQRRQSPGLCVRVKADVVDREPMIETRSGLQRLVTDELPVYVINQVPYYTAASKKVGNVPTSIWGPLSPLDEVYMR